MRTISHISFLALALAVSQPSSASEADCYRPNSPDLRNFENRADYSVATEEYYKQASRYLDCLNQWIEVSRARYQQMFADEAQTYLDERSDVMHELKRFVNSGH